MTMKIYRARDLYNTPPRKPTKKKKARPAKTGFFNVGRTFFYENIEPRLDRFLLGEKAVGYTGQSVEREYRHLTQS
jgi:hypothetical protein